MRMDVLKFSSYRGRVLWHRSPPRLLEATWRNDERQYALRNFEIAQIANIHVTLLLEYLDIAGYVVLYYSRRAADELYVYYKYCTCPFATCAESGKSPTCTCL